MVETKVLTGVALSVLVVVFYVWGGILVQDFVTSEQEPDEPTTPEKVLMVSQLILGSIAFTLGAIILAVVACGLAENILEDLLAKAARWVLFAIVMIATLVLAVYYVVGAITIGSRVLGGKPAAQGQWLKTHKGERARAITKAQWLVFLYICLIVTLYFVIQRMQREEWKQM